MIILSSFMKCSMVAMLIFGFSDLLAQQERPNIVIIYADDLGYGDVGVNGAIGVETPYIDSLAASGMNFTDAHCTASTCTPSRYSLLTGTFAFRKKATILPGDAPLIIDTLAETLPKMLGRAGYTTGVVGKWHLGLGNGKIDWNKRVSPGPAEVGFDYSFLIPATGDRVPCVFLENQYVVGLDLNDPITVSYGVKLDEYPIGYESPHLLKQHTDRQHQETIINGFSRIGYMQGGKEALWIDENFPQTLTDKAKSFIDKNKENPFFLYFSLHDIHQPRVANIKFVESSTMGPRGDVIAQLDWCVGQIMQQLDELDLIDNTMIIFTSDNGPVLDDGYVDYARELVGDHRPAGPYRGGKYSAFEAGTRVPTIVSWPGKVTKGTSDALISQVDLLSSLASLTKTSLQKQSLDSENYLDAWKGKDLVGREYMLEEAYVMGLRWRDWKYIQPTNRKQPGWITGKYIEAGYHVKPQLYNLEADPGETSNLYLKEKKITRQLEKKLNEIKTK